MRTPVRAPPSAPPTNHFHEAPNIASRLIQPTINQTFLSEKKQDDQTTKNRIAMREFYKSKFSLNGILLDE